jgi:hypothetical protein
VFVRSGTSAADVEPPPLPRMALPSRPPRSLATSASVETSDAGGSGVLERSLRTARLHPALWMVLAPAVLALSAIGLILVVTPARRPTPPQTALAGGQPTPVADGATISAEKPLPALAELEARPPESLTASELLRLADGREQQRQADAEQLGEKLKQNPDLLGDKATQAELLRLSRDAETAHAALGALATVKSPVAVDLLYEVWTGTPIHSESTELARALSLSTDVRPRASAALSVALDLRVAQSCEQFRAVLPTALKDGDRRSLLPLSKLASKRGCGPKKTEDCYVCLRGAPDELSATINAVKSRRAPAYPTP